MKPHFQTAHLEEEDVLLLPVELKKQNKGPAGRKAKIKQDEIRGDNPRETLNHRKQAEGS